MNFASNNVRKFFLAAIDVQRNAVNARKRVIMVNAKRNVLEY